MYTYFVSFEISYDDNDGKRCVELDNAVMDTQEVINNASSLNRLTNRIADMMEIHYGNALTKITIINFQKV